MTETQNLVWEARLCFFKTNLYPTICRISETLTSLSLRKTPTFWSSSAFLLLRAFKIADGAIQLLNFHCMRVYFISRTGDDLVRCWVYFYMCTAEILSLRVIWATLFFFCLVKTAILLSHFKVRPFLLRSRNPLCLLRISCASHVLALPHGASLPLAVLLCSPLTVQSMDLLMMLLAWVIILSYLQFVCFRLPGEFASQCLS